MERDDIAKVSVTLIGMDKIHCERNFVLNSRKNGKPVKTGWSGGNAVTSTT